MGSTEQGKLKAPMGFTEGDPRQPMGPTVPIWVWRRWAAEGLGDLLYNRGHAFEEARRGTAEEERALKHLLLQ